MLAKVNINHYFAKSVLNNKMTGTVFVDDIQNPSSFYITTQYGMSLLFGDMTNIAFNNSLADYMLNKHHDRIHDEWLQVYPSAWSTVVETLSDSRFISTEKSLHLADVLKNHPNSVIQDTRVNFNFNQEEFTNNKHKQLPLSDYDLVPVDERIFEQLQGSVVPHNFWHSAADFVTLGKGFSLRVGGELVATSYSASIDQGILEIGIETKAEFRGNGYAFIVCQALIEYCLARDVLPVWACRLGNSGSFYLAQKLGFEPSLYLPYYRLSKLQ